MSRSSSKRPKVPQSLNSGRFEIGKKLGEGCFGEVYRGVDTENKKDVAVKFEEGNSQAPQLEHEAQILAHLAMNPQPQGLANFLYCGREGEYVCLVMEFLGRSVEDRVQSCSGKLSVKTTVLIAEQVIRRIQYLHSRGVVHRDIKPENFMFGVRERQHHIYLIDFGLSKKYYDRNHVVMKQKMSLTGTARYASINAHRGIEQSRRDDLEAIGHMFLYLLRGSLPWSGLDAKSKQEKYRKIMEKKESTKLSELCAGFPQSFETYLRHCRGLEFMEKPDYPMLRKLFSDERASLQTKDGKTIEDWHFQWNEAKEMGKLEQLDLKSAPRQPDDKETQTGSKGFCFCFGGAPKVND